LMRGANGSISATGVGLGHTHYKNRGWSGD